MEQLTHYNYEIAYRPGDKNSVADALSRQEQHRPEQPDEKNPNVLFDPNQFIEIVLLAFIDEQVAVLEGTEQVYVLMDGQLLENISELTCHIDPLQWPRTYKLNDDLVLVSKETGHIWVPPDDQL